MRWYRIDDAGSHRRYEPFNPAIVTDDEEAFEVDLEQNDHVLLAPERILYIGRQTNLADRRALDLLGLTRDRRIVVIELKKNATPRQMMAQALEYAAFATQLSSTGLDEHARRYFERTGKNWTSVQQAHSEFFGSTIEPTDAWQLNPSPIILLEGQTIGSRTLDAAQFLRSYGVDVRVVQLSFQLDASGSRIVGVETVLGAPVDEPTPPENGGTQPALGELLGPPDVRQWFEAICGRLLALGLVRHDRRTSVSFQIPPSGGTFASLWPSPRGDHLVYLLIYGPRVTGNLDDFRAAADSLGFRTEKNRDLSVHIKPTDGAKLDELFSKLRDMVPGLA